MAITNGSHAAQHAANRRRLQLLEQRQVGPNARVPRELAARVGTTPSVISRLEDDDYEGHSLAMLRRIAPALD